MGFLSEKEKAAAARRKALWDNPAALSSTFSAPPTGVTPAVRAKRQAELAAKRRAQAEARKTRFASKFQKDVATARKIAALHAKKLTPKQKKAQKAAAVARAKATATEKRRVLVAETGTVHEASSSKPAWAQPGYKGVKTVVLPPKHQPKESNIEHKHIQAQLEANLDAAEAHLKKQYPWNDGSPEARNARNAVAELRATVATMHAEAALRHAKRQFGSKKAQQLPKHEEQYDQFGNVIGFQMEAKTKPKEAVGRVGGKRGAKQPKTRFKGTHSPFLGGGQPSQDVPHDPKTARTRAWHTRHQKYGPSGRRKKGMAPKLIKKG